VKDSTTGAVMFWQYLTIIRNGEKSLLNWLESQCPGIQLEEYISFYSLVNYAKLGQTSVWSQIYVHSKLMIVDDKTCIIGSANLNQRSLSGTRDSEIATVIHGQKFCSSLRKQLWNEHLQTEFDDMIFENQKLSFNQWTTEAVHNYNDLAICFGEKGFPNSKVQTRSDLKLLVTKSQRSNTPIHLKSRIIPYPVGFMENDVQHSLFCVALNSAEKVTKLGSAIYG